MSYEHDLLFWVLKGHLLSPDGDYRMDILWVPTNKDCSHLSPRMTMQKLTAGFRDGASYNTDR